MTSTGILGYASIGCTDLVTGLALLLPMAVGRGLFFGVRVSPEFLATAQARRERRRFAAVIVLLTAAAIGLSVCALNTGSVVWLTAAPLLLTGLGLALWAVEWRRAQPHRIAHPVERVANLGALPSRTALLSTLLALLPPLLVMAWLRVRWESIPARFPVHYDTFGQPNGWASRSAAGVYGPPAFGALLVLWIGIVEGIIVRYGQQGAHPDRTRRLTLVVLRMVQWMMASLFAMIGISPLLLSPQRWTLGIVAVFFVWILAMAVVVIRLLRSSSAGEENSTPDDAWRLGVIYWNKADAALMVPKRMGIGYTLNMANPRAWILMGLLLLVPLAGAVLLAVSQHR